MEIDPLLQRLTDLAPRFGRIRSDIETMVGRGRTGDYKGVMQNARLVLEALLRSLVTEELKQTPGKAMLDELVSKFRQQSNAGVIPTNILAHMGTVQAWGNLSSHDHAGSLADEGVKVGREEVVASLNSMAAILAWYADKRGLAPTPAAGSGAVAGSGAASPAPGAPQTAGAVHASGSVSAAAPPRRSGLVIGAAAVVVIVVGATAAVLLMPPSQQGTTEPPKGSGPTANPFEALDNVYAAWKEPPPPAACRNAADAPLLAKASADLAALSVIDKPGPEAAFLQARALFEQRKQRSPALDAALACPGFAAAEFLAGRIAFKEGVELEGDARRGKLDDAIARYAAAAAAAPKFLKARNSRALALAEANRAEDALVEINAVISADPDYGRAYVVRSRVHQQLSNLPEAKKDCERAVALGADQAKEACAPLLSSSP